jgi:hypothetical protein
LKKLSTMAKALIDLRTRFTAGLKARFPGLKSRAGTGVPCGVPCGVACDAARALGVVLGVALSFSSGFAQNIEGQIIASEYGTWTVPGYTSNAYSFAPGSCRVQGGASFFFAFNIGSPVRIVDANPALSETVTPSSYVDTNVTCAISIAPVNSHQLPFHLTSATGGLQEALSQNLTTPATNTIILNNAWYSQVAAVGGTPATVIGTVQGSANLGLVDITTVPTTWYQWNGSQYVKVSLTGTAGNLGTLQSDLVGNNQTNTAAVDLYDFVATAPTSGVSTYSPQAAIDAAAANNGSAIIQPGAGRTPFTNPGSYRVQDNRSDVPATARNVTEDGAQCDVQQLYGTLTQGSTTFTVQDTALSAADVGRVLVAVGTVGGVPTQFESTIVSITDSLHGVLTTAAPFTQAIAHEMDMGHDDTAAIAHTMAVAGGGGTLVFPEGACLTHTQTLAGQSPIGLSYQSAVVSFPGEDIFAAADASIGGGGSQGAAHIHDLSLYLDGRIDATQAWQTINDSGTTAHAANYRPIAMRSGVTNNPTAPGWFQGPNPNYSGAYNGAANITASSATICIPSTEAAPTVGETMVFPYLASVFTATVSSTAGTCSGGATPRTLSVALPAGSTNAQAEWFAGSSPQNLATAITSGTCPTTITLSNSITPVPGYESNVAPFGLVQIDGEQFTYFGRSNAGNTTPANTLYNVQCAQNGTTRANHSVNATVVPLNNFKPSYPWPVTPTLNSGDTTPAGTAGYFPGWNVGNAAFAFPLASGHRGNGTGSWGPNSRIENLNIWAWPNDINGYAWDAVNHTAAIYMVQPSYASVFSNLYTLYLFYGVAIGAPSIENGNYFAAQPTADGSHWDGVTIYAANPVNIPLGNQNTFSNFNVYSAENTDTGAGLGADTCYYFTTLYNDQTGGIGDAMSLDHFKNLYCENEPGAHDDQMPIWEWDTYNSEIEDQHMGGGGEVYIGGAQQHWIGGNFNNAINTPAISWGSQNTADYVANLGSEPKGNTYSVNSLINFGWGSNFSGTTSQAFSSPTGPFGYLQSGNSRAPIRSQTAETFNTGNLTAPYTSSEAGFITPEEFNANFQFEAQAMSQGWTYDATSPITNSYVGCNLGNDTAFIYCSTYEFNQNGIFIGPGQRLVPGKYTLYISAKDAVTASNSATITLFSNCGSYSNPLTIPLTNAWPTTAAGVFSVPVDLSSVTGSSCALGLQFLGATTADQIRIGYFAFAPVAEQLNAQTINVTNLNGPGGTTGCAQSPVTGIKNGYSCPTLANATTLTANQTSSATTITVTSTTGFSPAGCFFVDTEYECYASIASSTEFAGITRGAYTTTAASHNSGVNLVAVSLVLGSTQQTPSTVVAYGGGFPIVLSVNNGFPTEYGNNVAFEVNAGSNSAYIDTGGAIHQNNPSAQSTFAGSITAGTAYAINTPIAQTGALLQATSQISAYHPISLGGGHAGSLNVTTTANIGAPVTSGALPSGASTVSWVCSGTDFDGNLIPGTTTTLTGVAASWSYPQGIAVACPYAAGVNTFQIYRTAGGGSQGLIASGAGPEFWTSDFGGATSGGTPPASNGSNPHISVAGAGTPSIQLGPTNISTGTGAPTSTCGTAPIGSGSLWLRTDGSASTSVYSCAGTTWTAVTVP